MIRRRSDIQRARRQRSCSSPDQRMSATQGRPRSAARCAPRTASSPRDGRSPSTRARGSCGAGGNAIDGGVAAIFAAAVVEISHFGLGGEAPIIIYSARDRHVVVINGQGSAPKAATPADVRRQGRHSRQRAARRDAAGGGRLRVDRAGEVRHEVAVGRAAARDRAGRRLPDVRVPASLPRDRADGVRAVRVDDEHVLSRRPDHAGRRDVPSAESRRDAARAGGGRARPRWPAAHRANRRSRPGATRSTRDRSRAR